MSFDPIPNMVTTKTERPSYQALPMPHLKDDKDDQKSQYIRNSLSRFKDQNLKQEGLEGIFSSIYDLKAQMKEFEVQQPEDKKKENKQYKKPLLGRQGTVQPRLNLNEINTSAESSIQSRLNSLAQIKTAGQNRYQNSSTDNLGGEILKQDQSGQEYFKLEKAINRSKDIFARNSNFQSISMQLQEHKTFQLQKEFQNISNKLSPRDNFPNMPHTTKNKKAIDELSNATIKIDEENKLECEEDQVKIIAYSLSKKEVQQMIKAEVNVFQKTLFAS